MKLYEGHELDTLELPRQEGALKAAAPHASNGALLKSDEWVRGDLYKVPRAVRLNESESCWVDGCESPAAYIVYRRKLYRGQGVLQDVDPCCPFLCEQHRRQDEQTRKAQRGVEYTNLKTWSGCSIVYRPVLQP